MSVCLFAHPLLRLDKCTRRNFVFEIAPELFLLISADLLFYCEDVRVLLAGEILQVKESGFR